MDHAALACKLKGSVITAWRHGRWSVSHGNSQRHPTWVPPQISICRGRGLGDLASSELTLADTDFDVPVVVSGSPVLAVLGLWSLSELSFLPEELDSDGCVVPF